MKTHTHIESLETRIAPAGLVLAVYNFETRELTLSGDDLDNKVSVFQTSATNWRVEGRETFGTDPVLETAINVLGETLFDVGIIAKLTVATAGGDDRVEITNLFSLKSLNVDMGAGADIFKTEEFRVKGDAMISTGPGADVVEFDGNIGTVTGNLNITDSGDGLAFTFSAEHARVGGQVNFVGSAAVDQLLMKTDTQLRIGKGIDFTANGGNDRLTFGTQGTVAIGRDAEGRSVVYHGGDGNDRIRINSSSVKLAGSVEMDGGLGNDTVDVDGMRVFIGKSKTGTSVRLNGEDGNDTIDIQGSTLTVAGLIDMDGGAGEDLIDLSSVHHLHLNGGTHFVGGLAFDEFRIGADDLRVHGDIFFDGGDDGDEAEIEANGIIKGAITLHLAGAATGDQIAAIYARNGMPNSLKITGAVTVDATGGNMSIDDTKFTNLKLGGPLSIMLGDGDSIVNIDNVNARAVTIDMRGGNDDVHIEVDGNFGIATFRGPTSIHLGAGDDILTIGDGSEHDLMVFRSNLTADGGDGTDTRNDLEGDNEFEDGATVTATSFEIIPPPEV